MKILAVRRDEGVEYFPGFEELEACPHRNDFMFIIAGDDFDVLGVNADFAVWCRKRELEQSQRSDSKKGMALLKSLWHPGRN